MNAEEYLLVQAAEEASELAQNLIKAARVDRGRLVLTPMEEEKRNMGVAGASPSQ